MPITTVATQVARCAYVTCVRNVWMADANVTSITWSLGQMAGADILRSVSFINFITTNIKKMRRMKHTYFSQASQWSPAENHTKFALVAHIARMASANAEGIPLLEAISVHQSHGVSKVI